MNFSEYLFGVDWIEIEGNAEDVLNLLSLHRAEWKCVQKTDCGIELYVPRYSTGRIIKCLQGKNSVIIKQRKGFPILLQKIVYRPGIILGMAFFVAVMIFYGRFVFDIKINGNERLSDKYILDALENSGFRVGSYIPSIDFDELSNEVPIYYGDISWIFVNMMGNVAEVEVREYKKVELEKSEITAEATDLVAQSDGQVFRYEVSNGIVKVDIGEVVTKGQILVSGIEKGEKSNYYGKSTGKVFAKLESTITSSQPLKITTEREVSRKLIKKSVKFLGIEINLLKNSGNLDASCDIIEESRKLVLPDKTELPIVITERYAIVRETVEVTLEESEARVYAKRQFEEMYFEEFGNAEVLRMEKNSGIVNGEYRINCKVYCIKNIAREVVAERANTDKETEDK